MNDDSSQLVSDLRSALLWDTAALRRSRSAGATAFLEILDLRSGGLTSAREAHGDDPLVRAASGLEREFTDQLEDARRIYFELSRWAGDDVEARLIRMLGAALRCWSEPDQQTESFEIAAALADEEPDGRFKALYLAKISSFAYDQGRGGLAAGLLQRAIEVCPTDDVHLAWHLQLLSSPNSFTNRPPGVDGLLEYDWIVGQADDATAKLVKDSAQARVANVWAQSWRFGLTPIDQLQAANIQAEWAGARWLWKDLRLRLAEALILSSGDQDHRPVNAAAMWVLGGGRNIQQVVTHLEAQFDNGSMDELALDYLKRGARIHDQDRWADVLAATWDLLSHKIAEDALGNLRPRFSRFQHPTTIQVLWARLGVSQPDLWKPAFDALEPEEQAAILPALTPNVARRLDADAIRTLSVRFSELNLAASESRSKQDAGWQPSAAIALLYSMRPLEDAARDLALATLSTSNPTDRLRAASQLQDSIPNISLEEPFRDVLQSLRADIQGAREGRVVHYAYSPAAALADATLVKPEMLLVPEFLSSVATAAADPSIAPSLRLELLTAAYRLVSSLPEPQQLGSLPLTSTFHADRHGGGASADYQEVLFSACRYLTQRSNHDLANLIAASRQDDARSRAVAIEALGHSGVTDPLAWTALVGAIFDPKEDVVRAGLRAIRSSPSVPSPLVDLVASRLRTLYRQTGRSTRAVICLTASELARGPQSVDLSDLLAECQNDRSWLVRDAYAQADEGIA